LPIHRTDIRVVVVLAIAVAAPAMAAAQSTSFAITDVTVIDGTGAPPRANMTVVVRNGRIAAVDSTSRATIPANATIIGGRGKFLIPGLWDMHVHLAKAGDKALGLFVANGVTSVRDMGGDFALVQRWRSEIAAGTRVGPRIRTAGPILETAEHVRSMKESRAARTSSRCAR
jgi:hypothetical protein